MKSKSVFKTEEKIEDYKFHDFSASTNSKIKASIQSVENYSFRDLKEIESEQTINKFNKIIQEERFFSKEKKFEISPVVKHFRGLENQEKEEIEKKIEQEIEKRLQGIKEDAYKDGYKIGREEGKQELYNQMKENIDEKILYFSDFLNEVLSHKSKLLKEEKKKMFHLVRNLTKWLTLKELSDDGDYLRRLLEVLIKEIDTKNNLLIQVDKHYFDKMEDVLEILKKNVNDIGQVRIETDFDIDSPGMILSSANSLIDATLTEQFNALDKLFEPVDLSVLDNQELVTNININNRKAEAKAEAKENMTRKEDPENE